MADPRDGEARMPAFTVRGFVTVVWLAVLLGIGVQLLVLAAKLGAGARWPGAALFADFAQSTSWALLVCGSVDLGMAATRARTAAMGLLGFVSGPLAWGAAKGAQRVVQTLIGAPVDQFTNFFYLICAVKGVEYLILGAALGHMSERSTHHMRNYILLGACVGIVFAAAIVALNMWLGPAIAAPKIAALVAGELTFPIGCALVIYAPVRLKHYAGFA
jgi:hypothetical protein